MASINVRLPDDTKDALGELPGSLSDVSREALWAHAQASVIASASGVPQSLVSFLLRVADEALASPLTSDARADVMTWQMRVALAYSDARQGNLDAAACVLGRIPEIIKQRAQVLTGALEVTK